jgi:hypothetical protein
MITTSGGGGPDRGARRRGVRGACDLQLGRRGLLDQRRELLKSTATVGPLEAGATYGASLIDPTPN